MNAPRVAVEASTEDNLEGEDSAPGSSPDEQSGTRRTISSPATSYWNIALVPSRDPLLFPPRRPPPSCSLRYSPLPLLLPRPLPPLPQPNF